MSAAWLLRIEEVFEFDGRTVVAGAVENGPPWIPPGSCEVVVGERVVAVIEIEGEMMPSRGNDQSVGKRAVSIPGQLPIGRDEARNACLRPADPRSGAHAS